MKGKLGLARQKVRDFREKVQGLSRMQKVLVVFLVAAVPAGVALATALIVAWKRKK